jgi:hypothetical protein
MMMPTKASLKNTTNKPTISVPLIGEKGYWYPFSCFIQS